MEKPRVALRRCADYTDEHVTSAISRALADIGGMGKFVRKGERIILKVNLLRAAIPDDAVTTHPAFVRAVFREVEKTGALPVVADSPGGNFSAGRLRAVYRKTGLLELEQKGDIKLNYDTGFSMVPHPDGRVLKSVEMLKVIKESDGIITLPKMKTHSLTGVTGATKILYGIIPGMSKAGYHTKLPDVDDFCGMLIDILTLVRPRLALMDGILGMEGNGPSSGTPRWGKVVVASSDSAAQDIVMAAIMQTDPGKLPVLRAAIDRGLTTGRMIDIEVVGDLLKDFLDTPWKVPLSTHGMQQRMLSVMPAGLLRRFGNLLVRRPVPDKKTCTGCGECARNCPRKCIRMVNDRPRIDRKKCISCFCCSETCPDKAMQVRDPFS